jgi:hypothetical protein
LYGLPESIDSRGPASSIHCSESILPRIMKHVSTLFSLLVFQLALTGQTPSTIVYRDGNDHLRYETDTNQNRIQDFSHAGYRGGGVALPDYTVRLEIDPVSGDNTAHVQAAIDQVSGLTPDQDGVRGAVLLRAGTYRIEGQLQLSTDGVVLRGVGQESDPATNTILIGAGNTPTQRRLITVGGTGSTSWTREISNTRTNITSPYLPAGSRTLEVASTTPFSIGDNVIVYHPSTDAWLASINYGDTDSDAPWAPGEIDIYYNRYITAINAGERKITLDAPIHDHFDTTLAQPEIWVYNDEAVKREIGIENVRIDIETANATDENHAWTCIYLSGVENTWVRDVTGLHFGYAMVDAFRTTRTTIRGCSALEPHSEIDGGRRYSFTVGRETNNILFEDCVASQGRHAFVSNGTSSASGIVWRACSSSEDYAAIEGHRRWSQALLFDNLTTTNANTARLVGIYNRGRFGTGHGWSATGSVVWNTTVPSGSFTLVQHPPGRQNYGLFNQGTIQGDGPFDHPAGFIEGTDASPAISSLYSAQLNQRLSSGVAPDAPAKLTATPDGDDVHLSWLDIASGESGYTVEVSTDGGTSFSTLEALPPNTTETTHPGGSTGASDVIYRVFASGNLPSAYSNMAVVAGPAPLFTEQFDSSPQPSINTGNSAGSVTTFVQDPDCGILGLSITDPGANPLGANSPYLVRVRDDKGQRITNIDGRVKATFRVASAEALNLGVLFRSGGGSQAERTVIKTVTIPAGTTEWTDAVFEFSAGELAGFDATDLRDMWFYLERGTNNFRGNAFYIDHVTVGGEPETALNSDCPPNLPDALSVETFTDSPQTKFSTASSAGSRATYTVDEDCGILRISVTDRADDPLPPFNAYVYAIRDADGRRVTDLTDNVNVSMRVASAEATNVDVLFRSGDGSTANRTVIKRVAVPAGLSSWTNISFAFTGSGLAGLDPTDIRDLWIYLDRGAENFPGNEFYIDQITVGGAPDPATYSDCIPADVVGYTTARYPFRPGDQDRISRTNTAGTKTTFTRDDTNEWLEIAVTDPNNDPLPSFNAFDIPPHDVAGNPIRDLTGRVEVTMNVWSEETVELSALFRSDGNMRSNIKSATVPGNSGDWTSVTLTFEGGDLNDLDPSQIEDCWFYLDRGAPNFAGNRFVIDDITFGGSRDATLTSPAEVPVASGSALPVRWAEFNASWSADGTALLQWSTASESGSDRFIVEYARDAASFHPVGSVHAAGNSTTLSQYEFRHPERPVGNHYYRLRQVDVDGSASYSRVLHLVRAGADGISLYPNPSSETIHLTVSTPTPYTVLDASARRIRSGTTSGPIPIGDLRTGLYYIQVDGEAHRFIKR